MMGASDQGRITTPLRLYSNRSGLDRNNKGRICCDEYRRNMKDVMWQDSDGHKWRQPLAQS
jgi:hypothetical protein